MKVDSQTKTGEEVIGKLNRDALLELYSTEDIKADYLFVRSTMNDPDTSTKDKIALLKLVWEYTLEKPKTTSEVKVNNGLNILTDDELKELANKHHLDDEGRVEELGVNKTKTQD